MSLSISLYELRRLRKFLEYQEAYESRDVEADEWKDFVSVMESDKALNRLAESFGAESLASDKECPVCDESYNAVDEDGDQLCYCLCEFCSDAKPITTVRGEWVCKTCKNEHDNEPEDWMGAEGYDADIVGDFLKSSQIRPVIIFEYFHIPYKKFENLLDQLKERKYIFFSLSENLFCFPEKDNPFVNFD